MKPLFFPYTHISGQTVLCLKRLFTGVRVIRILPEHGGADGDDSFVENLMPLKSMESALKDFLSASGTWGSVHSGKGGVFLKSTEPVPFYDSTWSTQLRSDIRRTLDEDSPGEGSPDENLLIAGALLKLSEEYDRQANDIDREFSLCLDKEKTLLSSLHGDDETDMAFPTTDTDGLADDGSVYQLEKRMAAWAHIAGLVMGDPADPLTCYLTTHQAVIDYVREYFPEMIAAGNVASGCFDEEAVATYIHQLSTCNREQDVPELPGFRNNEGDGTCVLTLYVIPGTPPQKCFGRFLGKTAIAEMDGTIRNTVLGLIYRESGTGF